MKAIQISYLSNTYFKPARLKAKAEGVNAMEETRNNEDYHVQAEKLVKKFIEKQRWVVKISGMGQLPNGDWVATLETV